MSCFAAEPPCTLYVRATGDWLESLRRAQPLCVSARIPKTHRVAFDKLRLSGCKTKTRSA